MRWIGGLGPEITAVFITLLVTIIWTECREWLRERRERRRVASVLAAEILSQAAFVVDLGSAINFIVEKRTFTNRADLIRLLPSPHEVYSNLIDRLPILGASLGSNLIAFYDSVDRARHYTLNLPDEMEDDPTCAVRIGEIALAAKMASEIGLLIIPRLLNLSAGPFRGEMHKTILSATLSGLDAVRSGKSPSVA